MSLFSTFFGAASAADIVKGIDLGGFFYSDNYKESYPSLLSSTASSNRSRIAELYLFRAWVTNLGFRVFTSRKEVADRVTYELVNLSNTLGRAVLAMEYGVEFDKISNVDYIILLDSRWQHYDSVLLANQTDESPFADSAIAGAVLQLCRSVGDPISQMSVASGYLIQLAQIREVATTRR